MDIPSEGIIINALNHEIRREILRLLDEKSISYTNLLEYFSITTGKLNYHLKLLTGFITKNNDGFYEITPLGKRILFILSDFKNNITEEDKPLLKKAYFSQLGGNKSFLHIRLVGGIYFKIIAIIAILILIIAISILYAQQGVDVLYLWPLYLLLGILVPIGLIWVLKFYKPAKKFAQRVDKLLNDSE